jgi:activator of HSP90 ATPase
MKDFKYTLTIKEAEPEEVYNALTNPFAIELWSGYPATMELKIDSEFSMWEGDITGKILDFEKDSKLVQKWDFEGTKEVSVATIKIFPKKGNRSYIVLTHTNIPDEDYENITEGWRDFYLGAIKKFFEEE